MRVHDLFLISFLDGNSPNSIALEKPYKTAFRVTFFGVWVIPCQINTEFGVTSRISTKLGVIIVPVVLTTCKKI